MTLHKGAADVDRERACAFTGHRFIAREKLPRLEQELVRYIDGMHRRLGVTRFYAGGALGFDTLAAKTVLRLRDGGLPITLCLLLPCRDQDRLWSERDRIVYARILGRADSVEYLAESYSPGCMHARNRALIDRSKYCIAFLERSSGGTAYTVDYARRSDVFVVNLGSPSDTKI